MKTYNDLTTQQQQSAVNYELGRLVEAIMEGAIRFNDKLNGDDLQARIDKACQKADAMQTPWFAHEYILATCRDDLTGMAECSAEDAMYSEPGELVISLAKLR
jgi:lysozyme family protein